VTVDGIAADVGRTTVFQHFPRKEDMVFDLDEEARQTLRDAFGRTELVWSAATRR
jgi:AcrR family transcriptional regulator